MNRATTEVLTALAAHLQVPLDLVCSKDRHNGPALVRQLATYVLRECQTPRPTWVELGRELSRDHTTLIDAHRRARKFIANDYAMWAAMEVGRRALDRATTDQRRAAWLAKCDRRDALQQELRILQREIDEYSRVTAAE